MHCETKRPAGAIGRECRACARNVCQEPSEVNISSTFKVGQKLGVSLPLLTCSPSAWPSRLLYRRCRKSRRDLWITLYIELKWQFMFDINFIHTINTIRGPGVAYWLRHWAVGRTVPGSIPGGVTGNFFPWFTRQNHVPWGRLRLWKWVPGISTGVKAAGAFGWRPTTLVVPKRQENLVP